MIRHDKEQLAYRELQIDNQICLRGKEKNPNWKLITDHINNQFGTKYTVNTLIKRFETLNTKPSHEKIKAIMSDFLRYQLDFLLIAHSQKISSYEAKREVLTVLINNIWRICFVTRKKGISGMKKNLLGNANIKKLVTMILKEKEIITMKNNFSNLWKFITTSFEDSQYKQIPDDIYRLSYMELIILTQNYKINEEKCEFSDFQREVIQQQDYRKVDETKVEPQTIKEFLAMNTKKKSKQMIDLLSQEDNENEAISQELSLSNQNKNLEEMEIEDISDRMRDLMNTLLQKERLQAKIMSAGSHQKDHIMHQIALLAVRATILMTS